MTMKVVLRSSWPSWPCLEGIFGNALPLEGNRSQTAELTLWLFEDK